MADQLDLFAPSSAPLKWRRPSSATFFIVASKEPDRFEVRCVTGDEKHANPTPTYVAGKLVAEAGHLLLPGTALDRQWTRQIPVVRLVVGGEGSVRHLQTLGAFPESEDGG
jgi:hypothetical protein